ncbi:hypothetical protein PV726_23295 [Streptomyces europaeiscabiei]|uniref:hypothetical protein n=1 Tax=Streptomyces europaeiscabiei TaxID=146819 RepID=UPI0029B1F9BE|nr:hypothetical protein [Streptomyces europaeiscabiei]MDX3693219.1 hypothetical protein [Streptomyces europaeiscabiei]
MTANHPRRSRRSTRGRRSRIAVLATGVAALTLSAGLLTGCEFGDSLDCVSNADTIAESLRDIHRAGLEAAEDPARNGESIDTIEMNLDEINDRASDSDDSKVDQAVDDLAQAVQDYNRTVLDGDTDPDSSRIDAAAHELTDVCTS